MYCLKCKRKTDSTNITQIPSKNKRSMLQGICTICGSKKSAFFKSTEGGKVDIHSLVGKLPKPKKAGLYPIINTLVLGILYTNN